MPIRSLAEGFGSNELDMLHEQMNDRIGPVVPDADLPELYKLARETVERLQRAGEKTQGDHASSIQGVRILNSPETGVYTFSRRVYGTGQRGEVVYITTGTLRAIFAAKNSAHIGPAERLAGALASPLAAPFEVNDIFGAIDGYRKAQKNSLQGDYKGMHTLREAGYPPESLYETTLALVPDNMSKTTGEASRAWKAEKNLRLAAQRMALTMDRHEAGRPTLPPATAVAPNAFTEIQSLDPERENRFTPPTDFKDAMKRLKEHYHDGNVVLERNQLVLWLDHYFLNKGPTLNEADMKDFLTYNEQLAKTESDRPWLKPTKELFEIVNASNTPPELLKIPGHADAINLIPAYRQNEYLDWAVKKVKALRGEQWGAKYQDPDGTILAAQYLPQSYIAPNYAQAGTISEGGVAQAIFRAIGNRPRDFERQVIWGAAMYEALRKATPKTQLEYAQADPTVAWDPVLLQGDAKMRDAMEKFLAEPGHEQLRALHRKQLEQLWEDRGRWATLELVMPDKSIDWEYVWKTLGISREHGRASLNAAVAHFTESPQYAELLKAAESEKYGHPDIPRGNTLRGQKPSWAMPGILSQILGRTNPAIRTDTELRRRAASFGKGFTAGPELKAQVQRRLRQALDALDPAKPVDDAALKQVAESVATRIFGAANAPFDGMELEWAQAVRDSKLPLDGKRQALKQLFMAKSGRLPFGGVESWLTKSPHGETIARLVMDHATVGSILELVGPTQGAAGMIHVKDMILAEMRARFAAAPTDAAKQQVLKDYVKLIHFKSDNSYYYGQNHSVDKVWGTAEIGELKGELLKLSGSLRLTDVEKLDLVASLNVTGPCAESDRFLIQNFVRGWDAVHNRQVSAPDPVIAAKLIDLLEKRGVLSAVARARLAREALEPKLREAIAAGSPRTLIDPLLAQIHELVPQASTVRDELLESIALRAGLRGKVLQALIEDQKSGNWTKGDPMIANLGSALSHAIQEMPRDARIRTLQHLLGQRNGVVPPELLEEVRKSVYETFIKDAQAKLEAAMKDNRDERDSQHGPISFASLRSEADAKADQIFRDLETALVGSSPTSRIPLLDVVLNASQEPLFGDPKFVDELMRDYLKFKPGSFEEKAMRAYLKVVPAHEASVSLSYLLSQSGQDKSSTRALFEVFQTVGIKFGQLSSVWKLFGPEIAKETAGLKENARPLTVAEIEKVFINDLGAEEAGKIGIKKILGCGGIACAIEMEYTGADGKLHRGVTLVKRPNAEGQVASNVRLSRDFLTALRAEGAVFPPGSYEALLADLDSQIQDELKFEEVMKKITQAKADFTQLGKDFAGRLPEGVHFHVPGLLTDVTRKAVHPNLIFLEHGDGTSWEKLVHEETDPAKAQKVRERFGEAIVVANLRRFFQFGRLNADEHGGNVLINTETGQIQFIDFGQDESFRVEPAWKADELTPVSDFLRGIAFKDARLVTDAAEKMGAGPLKASDKAALQAEVGQILGRTYASPDDQVRALRAAFDEHGLHLKRKYSFGMMKGLLILSGEGYVPEARFREILADEVARHTQGKLPYHVISGVCRGDFRGVYRLVRGGRP